MKTDNNPLFQRFQRSLNTLYRWFETHQRILPWRDTPDPYRVWISEIMLQQTQVKTVIPFFNRFIERFPGLDGLASATLEEVLPYWSGLGYYSRVRNLHKTAQLIADKGRFPETREDLLKLPGIGEYTAGAILSIAFNHPEPILDGNLKRIFQRITGIIDRPLSPGRLWNLARLFVKAAWRIGLKPSVINQALMETGALICSPAKPDCSQCPLSAICRSFQTGTRHQPLKTSGKKTFLELAETRLLLLDQERNILLKKIPEGQWHAGLYDLPDENALNLAVVLMDEFKIQYTITRHRITRTVKVFRVESFAGEMTNQHNDLRVIPLLSAENAGIGVTGSFLKCAKKLICLKI